MSIFIVIPSGLGNISISICGEEGILETGNFLITSDMHFGHDNDVSHSVLEFERGDKFSTIQEHDEYLENMLERGLRKLKGGDTFYFLGDWGELRQDLFNKLKRACEKSDCRKVTVLGNHDKQPQIGQLLSLGFEVYDLPIFIDKRVVLSHHPYLQAENVLNVCGHLHGSYLNRQNSLCASVAVAGYTFITKQAVQNRLAQMPKWDMRFLYEPFAADYIFLDKKRKDVVMDKDGRIDLSASRVLRRLLEIRQQEESIGDEQAAEDGSHS